MGAGTYRLASSWHNRWVRIGRLTQPKTASPHLLRLQSSLSFPFPHPHLQPHRHHYRRSLLFLLLFSSSRVNSSPYSPFHDVLPASRTKNQSAVSSPSFPLHLSRVIRHPRRAFRPSSILNSLHPEHLHNPLQASAGSLLRHCARIFYSTLSTIPTRQRSPPEPATSYARRLSLAILSISLRTQFCASTAAPHSLLLGCWNIARA